MVYLGREAEAKNNRTTKQEEEAGVPYFTLTKLRDNASLRRYDNGSRVTHITDSCHIRSRSPSAPVIQRSFFKHHFTVLASAAHVLELRIQKRPAWPLSKDSMQMHEVHHTGKRNHHQTENT